MQNEARHYPAFPTLISSFDLKDHPCEKTVIEMIETWNAQAIMFWYTKVKAVTSLVMKCF